MRRLYAIGTASYEIANGTPRPMNMGTIRSPWRHDLAINSFSILGQPWLKDRLDQSEP